MRGARARRTPAEKGRRREGAEAKSKAGHLSEGETEPTSIQPTPPTTGRPRQAPWQGASRTSTWWPFLLLLLSFFPSDLDTVARHELDHELQSALRRDALDDARRAAAAGRPPAWRRRELLAQTCGGRTRQPDGRESVRRERTAMPEQVAVDRLEVRRRDPACRAPRLRARQVENRWLVERERWWRRRVVVQSCGGRRSGDTRARIKRPRSGARCPRDHEEDG